MNGEDLLRAYGQKYGFDAGFDASGMAAFDMGEGLEVYFETNPEFDAMMMHAVAATVRDAGRELLSLLLGINQFYGSRSRVVAAYDENTGDVILLSRVDPEHTTLEAFEAILADLVSNADTIGAFIEGGGGESPEDADGKPDAVDPGGLLTARA